MKALLWRGQRPHRGMGTVQCEPVYFKYSWGSWTRLTWAQFADRIEGAEPEPHVTTSGETSATENKCFFHFLCVNHWLKTCSFVQQHKLWQWKTGKFTQGRATGSSGGSSAGADSSMNEIIIITIITRLKLDLKKHIIHILNEPQQLVHEKKPGGKHRRQNS